MPALQHFVMDGPEAFFAQFSPSQLKVIAHLFYLDSRYNTVYVAQGKIGIIAGLSREYVNRILLAFEQAGIVKIVNRGVKKTCLYLLSNYFRDPINRARLVPFFACFSFMPFNAYVCRGGVWQKRDQIEHVTQLYNKSIFNSSITVFRQSSLSSYSSDLFKSQSPQHVSIDDSITYVNNCRKREKMNEKDIRPSILALKSLNLTLSGQITLMQFPDEAIVYAVTALKKASGVQDSLRFFLKVCHEYCKDNNLKRDYNAYNALLDTYKLPANEKLSNTTLPAFTDLPGNKIGGSPQRVESRLNYAARMKSMWQAHEKGNNRDPQRNCIWKKTEEQQREYLASLPMFLLQPFLRLAFASSKVDQIKKMNLVRTMTAMSISFEGILSNDQIAEIVWVGITATAAPAPDILGSPENLIHEGRL